MASELRVDTLKSANGNNSVATSTIASGTIKAYVCYTTDTNTAIHGNESFNHSSLQDNGAGATKFTMASPMSVALFSLSDSGGDATAGYSSWVDDNEFSTTTYEFNIGTGSFGSQDGPYHAGQVIGDLA